MPILQNVRCDSKGDESKWNCHSTMLLAIDNGNAFDCENDNGGSWICEKFEMAFTLEKRNLIPSTLYEKIEPGTNLS